jgi:hypothetical protein
VSLSSAFSLTHEHTSRGTNLRNKEHHDEQG